MAISGDIIGTETSGGHDIGSGVEGPLKTDLHLLIDIEVTSF